ncbi:MAG: hypothetical protein WAM94_11225 [Chromatiaceae bacterium]
MDTVILVADKRTLRLAQSVAAARQIPFARLGDQDHDGCREIGVGRPRQSRPQSHPGR